MKLILGLIFILNCGIAFTQEQQTVPLKSRDFPPVSVPIPQNKNTTDINNVKKGIVYLTDGTKAKFVSLSFVNDSVYYLDDLHASCKFPLDQVERVSQVKSNTLIYSITGAAGGFFVGVIAGGLIHPERTFWEFLSDRADRNDELRITKEQAPFVIVGTVAGALIGGIIGNAHKTEITVFQRELTWNIYPEFGMFSAQNQGFLVTCRISLH